MKNFALCLGLVVLFCDNVIGQDKYKTLVTYLGTDFIMSDGCPPPNCDQSLRDCRKEQLDQEAEYNACIRYFRNPDKTNLSD